MGQSTPILFNDRHILPGGRIPLRIPAGDSLDTLVFALKHGLPIGVCMAETQAQRSHVDIGTFIEIEDYTRSQEDGCLVITARGTARFAIHAFNQQHNHILFASVNALPRWPDCHVDKQSEPLVERLQSMFERYPELQQMHRETEFSNLAWLCQRWLELLPLPTGEKQQLMANSSCVATRDYLLSMMQDPH
ncbi:MULTISPECIES: LON peptidase substrate-binding domain-containing protein [unclassified Salinivibrio]|uniref:LON peptidase substrate-binding domain-containing protein n=1 Tax=unclassified Salinivibrio TaxID=2636825 RepID=UPI0009856CB9|nr:MULTISPECIES: LON peptidase substrate-binding domain-containing protein [unclassified Salinivibrio]MPS32472.1 Lon protease [Salinivibrio sp. VYel7]MPX90605.1 Lon protease [Salinivibrio sp. VYel1]MPX93865.1 Lon protease [Salinivibrio sp. VYel9]MPX96102.1 Lon protease [Salinivibrio sp. VYel6]MPY00330.1 Lon protease [Salinivibrio sp. VYel4]